MDAIEMRRRVSNSMVARLATIGQNGRPHIVPITFALGDDELYFAVDHKPKRTPHLQRLRNIEANPAVSVLVDHYEDDWKRLWWVRVDGRARIVNAGKLRDKAIELLSARYAQYRSLPPAGPVVAIAVERISGWSAS
jgi:PPOX class probable F420-dependent enzyme